MKKAILVLVLGGMNIIYSLAGLIESYELVKYEDNGGYSIGFDQNYLFWLVNGIFILVLGIFMYNEVKKSFKSE